jgi:hypothetical protein
VQRSRRLRQDRTKACRGLRLAETLKNDGSWRDVTDGWSFEEWLMRTWVLQREAFGVDPYVLKGKEREEYVRWNVLAAEDELHEALGEISWKPWASKEFFNRDQFVGELVDVLHFVANLLVVSQVTGDELTARYSGKQQKNRDRQSEGYDGVSGKCPGCKRDLQEVPENHDGPWCVWDALRKYGYPYFSNVCPGECKRSVEDLLPGHRMLSTSLVDGARNICIHSQEELDEYK